MILFTALFVWLKSGIHMEHLDFDRYEVDGLYIKLDKKLTLMAESVKIPKQKKRPSFDNLDEVLDRVKNLLTFFHYIELEKVKFENNHYKVIYADNVLYIESDDYEIAGNIWRKGRMLIGDISLFVIKKEDISMVAKFNYDLDSDKLILKGNYDAYHITGACKVIKQGQNVEYIVNSDTFSDFKTLIDKFKMDKGINKWMTENVKAKRYRLYSLIGKGQVYDSEFHPNFQSMKGEALLEDVKIYYKEGLSPIRTERVLLKYENNGLSFDLTKPRYENMEINGSRVFITDIGKGKSTRLTLDMHFYSKFDEVVQEILKAYDLNIPIMQKDSRSKVRLKLLIPLTDPDKKVDVYVKAYLGKGNMYLENLKLPVQSGEATFHKGVLILKSIKLKSLWFEATVGGKVYTGSDEGKADLSLNVKKIELGEGKKKDFVLKNHKIPLTIYYGEKRSVLLPSFGIKAVQNKNGTQIKVNDLTKIIPFLNRIPIELDGGHLTLDTKDFKRYTFKGEIVQKSCYLYGREHKVCFTKIPCFGTVEENGVDFYAFGKRLHYNSEKSLVSVNNLNIDLQRLIESRQRMSKGKTESRQTGKLLIKGDKSNLRYDKYTLVMDSYWADIYFSSGNIKARGVLGKDVVHFTKKGDLIFIEALRIHDKMLHPLINFNGLHDGRYTIRLSGTPGKQMKGEIVLEGGILSRFKAYDKTRNFVRNDKNLSQLKDPGFTEKGFKIREGKILYRIIRNKVIFDTIYIKGDTATIVGKGTLDIKTKKLDINMAVQTVRKLGKIVGSVPVLGYILMGKDNSITFGLKLTGTLDNPKVESSAAKDILMLPFDLIRRTLQSPAHIIDSVKKKKTNKKPTMEEILAPKNRVAP